MRACRISNRAETKTETAKETMVSKSAAVRLTGIALALLSLPAVAAPPAAKVVALVGTVSAQLPNGTVELLADGATLPAQETITTQKNSYVRLRFSDGGFVTLRPQTVFRVSSYHFNKSEPKKSGMVASLFQGGMRAIDGMIGHTNPAAYKVHAGAATIGVLGTQYGLLLCKGASYESGDTDATGQSANAKDNWHQVCAAKGLYLKVYQGKIAVTNKSGRVQFTAGEYGKVVSSSKKPELMKVNPDIDYALPASMDTSKTLRHLHALSSAGDCLAE